MPIEPMDEPPQPISGLGWLLGGLVALFLWWALYRIFIA